MPKTIDLNCDMGESYGRWTLGADEAIMPLISSANVACGFHGGDPHVMRKTVELALAHGVALGAHPSLPDLMGFGRRKMDVSPRELQDYFAYQTGALRELARAAGADLQHMKPHGILYGMMESEEALAVAAGQSAMDSGLILMTLASGRYDAVCRKMGARVASEGFADRAYNVDGTLVSRKIAGSLITDPARAAAQAVQMATEGKVRTIDGGRDRHLGPDHLLPWRYPGRRAHRARGARGAGEGGLPGQAAARLAARPLMAGRPLMSARAACARAPRRAGGHRLRGDEAAPDHRPAGADRTQQRLDTIDCRAEVGYRLDYNGDDSEALNVLRHAFMLGAGGAALGGVATGLSPATGTGSASEGLIAGSGAGVIAGGVLGVGGRSRFERAWIAVHGEPRATRSLPRPAPSSKMTAPI